MIKSGMSVFYYNCILLCRHLSVFILSKYNFFHYLNAESVIQLINDKGRDHWYPLPLYFPFYPSSLNTLGIVLSICIFINA